MNMFFKNKQKYKSLDLKLKHKKHDLYTWLLILCDQKKKKANIYGHQNGSLLEQYIYGKIGTQRVQYHFA